MKRSMFMWFNIFQARRIHFLVLFFLHWITILNQLLWNPFYTKMIRKWSIYHLPESEQIGWWLLMTCKVKTFSSMVKKQHSQTRESHLDLTMLWPLTPLTMSSCLVILMVFSSITINKNLQKWAFINAVLKNIKFVRVKWVAIWQILHFNCRNC